MSQENVEISRRLFEDVQRRGSERALRELYHPDVVMRHVEDWPEPYGREAFGED